MIVLRAKSKLIGMAKPKKILKKNYEQKTCEQTEISFDNDHVMLSNN